MATAHQHKSWRLCHAVWKKEKTELCRALLSTIAGVCDCVTEQLVVAVIAWCMQWKQKIVCQNAFVRMKGMTACLWTTLDCNIINLLHWHQWLLHWTAQCLSCTESWGAMQLLVLNQNREQDTIRVMDMQGLVRDMCVCESCFFFCCLTSGKRCHGPMARIGDASHWFHANNPPT